MRECGCFTMGYLLQWLVNHYNLEISAAIHVLLTSNM